jgi:type I restriction enzyme R subunit
MDAEALKKSMDAQCRARQIAYKMVGFDSRRMVSNFSDLTQALVNAIMDAFSAHSEIIKQALKSEQVQEGLKDIELGPAQLYEALRQKGERHAAP